MNDIDVLIIGGGLQGLVVLNDLTAAGYSALLVTDAMLGGGQTLHSHGLLNSGIGLVTGELQAELRTEVLPRLRRLGVPVYGEDVSYLGFPPAAVQQLSGAWDQHDYHPEPVPESDRPAGLTSALRFFRVPGYHVAKASLVGRLSAGLEARMVRGRVVPDGDGYRVDARSGEVFRLRPQATVVATGCGTGRLLTDVLGVGTDLGSRISCTTNLMLCPRSPIGVLPSIGTVMTPAVMVAGHINRRHETVGSDDTVSWYVSPPVDEATRHRDAPDDASAVLDPGALRTAIDGLRDLFGDVDWDDPRIEATAFAGAKQDIDGRPTQRLLELADADRRIVVALPGVLANTFANSRDLLPRLSQLDVRPDHSTDLPVLPGVGVGTVPELRPDIAWEPFAAVALRGAVAGSPSATT